MLLCFNLPQLPARVQQKSFLLHPEHSTNAPCIQMLIIDQQYLLPSHIMLFSPHLYISDELHIFVGPHTHIWPPHDWQRSCRWMNILFSPFLSSNNHSQFLAETHWMLFKEDWSQVLNVENIYFLSCGWKIVQDNTERSLKWTFKAPWVSASLKKRREWIVCRYRVITVSCCGCIAVACLPKSQFLITFNSLGPP